MNKQDVQFAKTLVEAIGGLFPGGSQAKGFASLLLERVLSGDNSHTLSIENVIRRKSADLSKHFLHLEQVERISQGWGRAAGADLAAILSLANLTPRLLIELRLDTDLLWAYLKEVGEPILKTVGAGRKSCIIEALSHVSEAVLEIAPELSSVRLEFMRQTLKRLPVS